MIVIATHDRWALRGSTFHRKSISCVNVGWLANPLYADLLLALSGLGNVIRGLHPHERVHLDPEGFFNTQRHVPGKVGLAVEQAGQSGRETRSAAAAAVTDRPAGEIISVRIKSPGWGGFFIGMAIPPSILVF